MKRVYNFSPGPSVLPLPVLEQAQKDLVDYQGKGLSVMEMSHRSKMFDEIIQKTESSLRKLMHISDDYHVLFLQGGASLQFSMVPLNLIGTTGKADYIVSGSFASKAAQEAAYFGKVNVVASSKDVNFTALPKWDKANFDPEAAYFHITTNNTIYGTQFNTLPDTGNVPLVADMSSNILGKEYDVNKFALIYAGAQKNIGPAGLTVVIIRKDLAERKPLPGASLMLQYAPFIKENSLYNTPSCWSIYVAGLVLDWLEKLGGVPEMEKTNTYKANLLYDCIENSKLYKAVAVKEDRSIMNITYVLKDESRLDDFVKYAGTRGIINIKGHRSVGGLRASMYNAMPVEGTQALIECMKDFELGKA